MKSLLFSKKNIDFIGIYLRTLKVSLLQFSIIEKERKASIRHNASQKLKVHLQLSLFLIKKTVGINSRILKVKYKANE